MLTSPEEYLAGLSFDPPEPASHTLTSGEKIFIEKYLGMEALELLPEVEPARLQLQRPFKIAEPQKIIEIAPEEPVADCGAFCDKQDGEQVLSLQSEVSPKLKELALQKDLAQPVLEVTPEVLDFKNEITAEELPENASSNKSSLSEQKIEALAQANFGEAEKEESVQEANLVKLASPDEPSLIEQPTGDVELKKEDRVVAQSVNKIDEVQADKLTVMPFENREIEEKGFSAVDNTGVLEIAEEIASQEVTQNKEIMAATQMDAPVSGIRESTVPKINLAEQTMTEFPSLKEKLKDEAEIQTVSFFIGNQVFLLPVMAIQEVLRHQELIKVPQAPDFVAGVINLRGRVTPIVYLSSLLTNQEEQNYSEKNFIIICGTEQLQIGLIIDRIKSMHLLPQNKIIWNAEAKLGDAAEFLCAIVDLDDKVCGMVAPENIAQKILSQ